MSVDYFVDKQSIVRRIWGRGDTVLFIFAGAAAEFALNKAVDWLYFTGKLPGDPLGRLFSTVSYARAIVFAEKQAAIRTITSMAAVHAKVEAKRGTAIPDWAYRDVLFMLIDYSIRAFEILDRKMTRLEKHEVFTVFNRVGVLMGVQGLPETYEQWEVMRQSHMSSHLQRSEYTTDLFIQYRRHLGAFRYKILLESQKLVVPIPVRAMLKLGTIQLMRPLLELYRLSKRMRLDGCIRSLIMPGKYEHQIKALDELPVV